MAYPSLIMKERNVVRSQRLSSGVLVRCIVAQRRFFSDSVECEGAFGGEIYGQWVLIEQDEPSEEPGRYWEDEAASLPLLQSQYGAALPPKTSASLYKGLPRKAPPVKKSPLANVTASDQEGSARTAKR